MRDLDPNARCTVNDFNAVYNHSSAGGEHKCLLLDKPALDFWFRPHTLPYDPISNSGYISRPT